jgi:hypothetical protein
MGSETSLIKKKQQSDVMMTTHQDHNAVAPIFGLHETYLRARKNLFLVIVGNDADLDVLHLW